MIKISLILNILVLIPVCFGIISGSEWACSAWGSNQPSLYILASIYCTILLASVYLLNYSNLHFIFALLSFQVIYKILSAVFFPTLHNPVIVSNLMIAGVHLVSLYLILKSKDFCVVD